MLTARILNVKDIKHIVIYKGIKFFNSNFNSFYIDYRRNVKILLTFPRKIDHGKLILIIELIV